MSSIIFVHGESHLMCLSKMDNCLVEIVYQLRVLISENGSQPVPSGVYLAGHGTHTSIHQSIDQCAFARVRHAQHTYFEQFRVFRHVWLLNVQALLLGFKSRITSNMAQ